MERLDEYLTRRAQQRGLRDAVVVVDEGSEDKTFILRRGGRDLVLGHAFHESRRALDLLARAEAPEPEQP